MTSSFYVLDFEYNNKGYSFQGEIISFSTRTPIQLSYDPPISIEFPSFALTIIGIL